MINLWQIVREESLSRDFRERLIASKETRDNPFLFQGIVMSGCGVDLL